MWTAIRNVLAVPAVVAVLTAPAAAAVPEPFTAVYWASRGILGLGEATFSLDRIDENCWHWRGVARPTGFAALLADRISDDSRFCVGPDGRLRPERFEHEEEGDPEDSYRLVFDWDNDEAVLNDDKRFDVPEGAVDPFLLQLAARRWLAEADDPLQLPDREFVVVDEDDIKHYRLTVSKGGRIETPAGVFENTLRVARIDDPDKEISFWTVPDLDFLPVRMEQRKNGKVQIRFELRNVK